MLAICLLGMTTTVCAEELRLTVPEMEPKLVYAETPRYIPELERRVLPLHDAATAKWTSTEPAAGVRPYKVLEDLTFVGVPVFVAGIIAKGEKKYFAQQYQNSHANTRLLTSFKTGIDDYTQYFGPAMTLGLKIGGVEGRSDWGRLAASAAMSYGIMAAFVNGIKYTAKEMRPDGSTANSWPSGHTATSFVGATILHKEYGLTRSPWFSIAGYGVATATGVMRVLNNRHWVSDVLSGAGIGIMSGELAYALSDVIFKGRGLLRNDMEGLDNTQDHPSFFSVSMSLGLGSKDLDFEALDEGDPIKMSFQTSTAVQAEGAYFINKYVGIGGRLRVKTSPVKGWENFMGMAENDAQETLRDLKEMQDMYGDTKVISGSLEDMLATKEFTIESDHLTEFAADAGLYFNIPLSKRFSLGTKLLVGRSIMQELDLNAHYAGTVKNLEYNATISTGELTSLDITGISTAKNADGTDKTYDVEWDYLTLSANSSTKWGTGISLSYAYKKNFLWKVFCDYDYTKKNYTLTYDADYYVQHAMPEAIGLAALLGMTAEGEKHTIRKSVNSWVIGVSFAVSF
jgi:membrane-associated phospholipid phosphatase